MIQYFFPQKLPLCIYQFIAAERTFSYRNQNFPCFVYINMKAHETLTTLVVMDENTLGFILPQSNMVSILRASVLKGATWRYGDDPQMPSDNIRLANEKDFDAYRVYFGSFGNRENYLYS